VQNRPGGRAPTDPQGLPGSDFHGWLWRQAMGVYPKIPGTRFSSVGAQPSGRSCAESPGGQRSYRPAGFAGFRFSWLVVVASHGGLSENRLLLP
jgi:hypothetical protein